MIEILLAIFVLWLFRNIDDTPYGFFYIDNYSRPEEKLSYFNDVKDFSDFEF